jgi:hypothetical protein
MAEAMGENPQYHYLRDQVGPIDVDIDSVASNYDFIFIQERLEESLVAFAIEYNLGLADIAHLSAKVRTGKYPDASKLPTEINDLVRSKTGTDLELWQHANRLLDRRIATISQQCGGTAYFEAMVARFREVQALVAEECDPYKEWYKQHGFTTMLSYWSDNGEGPRCRDHVVRQIMQRWKDERV